MSKEDVYDIRTLTFVWYTKVSLVRVHT